jgi:protein DGCR14
MPPPPFKRIKRPPKVLDEDEYTQALSDIIARDYFPGLLEGQAQHEYLAALESGNDAWIAEAARKLRQSAAPATGNKRRTGRNTRFDSTPSATPTRAQDTPLGYTGSETPISVAGSDISDARVGAGAGTGSEPQTRNEQLDLDTATLSLSAFQAKYTSEDNESFNTVLDSQNQKRRVKHAHLWTQDQRLPSARQIAYRAHEARLLKQKAEADDAATADGKALIPISSGAVDSRPARPDSWTIQRPDNTFMFPAGSVDEDGIPTVQQVREQNSKAGPKEVVHANTRFPPLHAQYMDDDFAGPVPPSPSLNTDIIARRGLHGVGPESEVLEFAGSETPRVNGYAFVDEDEPENVPSANTSAPSYRDLLAGQVGDGTPNPFKISEIRKREDLHRRMVERQARKKRDEDKDTVRTPISGAAAAGRGGGARTPAAGNVTPAARRLMERLGARTPLPGAGAAAGPGGAASGSGPLDWTPGRTPRRKTLLK